MRRRLRYRLIRWLARGESMVGNVTIVNASVVVGREGLVWNVGYTGEGPAILLPNGEAGPLP